ncbi:TraB/GumN family protein [Niabella sp. 3A5MI-3]|nr:TraB/GumN family protein [Niabella beijingensis]
MLTALTLSATFLNAQEARSMLWKISGNNLSAPSYLLGTMHMVCGEDFEITPKIKKALSQVHTVTFEADIANMEGSEKLMELVQPVPGILKQARPEQLTALDSLFKENQLTLDVLNHMSPFGVTSILTIKAFNCDDRANVKMMEKELYNLAVDDSLRIDHLESIEFQINMIRSMNTIDELLTTLKGIREAPYFMKDLVGVYRSEDLPRLNTLMSDPRFISTDQQSLLLKERNHNWIKLLPGKMQQSATLFAVGAGHLGGTDGLIALLKKQGYTVTPVFD